MLSDNKSLFKAILFLELSLLLLGFVKATEDKKRQFDKEADSSKIPKTLAEMYKLFVDLEQRFKLSESRRIMMLRGRDGRDGQPGKPGQNGRNGRHGSPGPRGPPGSKGNQGNPGMRGPPGPKSGGVQYVRWGRTTCPSGVSLVYKGRTGGERYNHGGGGANYVCLPEIPKYGRYQPGHQYAGFMYGTEYYLGGVHIFNKGNLHDHEVPCAVCYVTTRSTKLMIPATYECPAGWTREYHGYLMSERHNHGNKNFICVDVDAEAVPGTHANVDGAMVFPIEGRCGALPCLPYVEGRELTCAVCTK